ncbi:MAG: transketolase [Candidatus Omnitrophica bacterium]|nr:transketolase [Candidatus Omnitrophota bacterium]
MEKDIQFLKDTAKELRKNILKMVCAACSGHPGGALSAAEIITALYYGEMHVDPKNPQDPDRDRFILSKGHTCPVLYSVLAMKGYFPLEELQTLRKINGRLQGHPDMNKTPGVDSTAGSLGNGLSIGIGMALMAKLDKKSYRTYVLLGCGELNEGLIWEAAMAAAKFKIDNLLAIVDYNRLQLDGTNDEVMPLEPLADKWKAFNWNVITIDGHDFNQILGAFRKAGETVNQPTVIIANTVKGKGVSFMENKVDWHGKAPNKEQLETALREIENDI